MRYFIHSTDDAETRFELWYNTDGVSSTEYDDSQEPPGETAVVNEWWYTWPEVFAQLTGKTGHKPEIHKGT